MARVMPQNQEAEMCILGIAFLDKYLLDKICESLNVDMFYDERNKYLFEAINDLHNEDIPLDSNVLKDELIIENGKYTHSTSGIPEIE